MIELPWTEKYRPKTVSDVVGIKHSLFDKILLHPSGMPNLLLYSTKPGTGKTSLARAIIKALKADSLILNASDDRKIEVIREKVKRFVESMSTNPSSPRVVLLDEIDGMLKASQEALRSLMEMYPAKFILTCNNIKKVIEPLQSRCQRINMQLPKREQCDDLLIKIAEKEKMIITSAATIEIVNLHYPCIRNMVMHLQKLSDNGGQIEAVHVKKQETEYDELFKLIHEDKADEARKIWITNGYPLREVLKHFFNGYETMSQELVNLFAEADYRMAMGADEDIALYWFATNLKK